MDSSHGFAYGNGSMAAGFAEAQKAPPLLLAKGRAYVVRPMKIFAMADFHLSLSGEKPMTKFGDHWDNHPERIKEICEEMITDEQKTQLEALWRVYGNEGPKWTIGNHKLIQRMIFVEDAQLDEVVERYNKLMDGDPDKAITDECLAEVKKVLG